MKLKPSIAVIGLKGLPAFGGAAAVGENVINLLKEDFKFTVYSTSSHTNLESGTYNGFKQVVLSSVKMKKINTLFYYIKTAIIVFFKNYDLVHIHHSDSAFIIPLLRLRHKVIVTTHGSHNSGKVTKWKKYRWFFKIQIKYFLKFSNFITCVSKVERKWLFDKTGMKAQHIPNGILKHSISKNYKKFKKYDLFYGAGRIMKSKGCDYLLKSLKEISFKGSVGIAGDLSSDQNYEKIIYEISSNLNVKFLGMIKKKENLFDEIKSSRLFIYPSFREAMSMMLLEVASLKVPILCSDIAENREIFNDSEALFFNLDDTNDLSEKIIWALKNEKLMNDRAENAYVKLISSYTWEQISKLYANVYTKELYK